MLRVIEIFDSIQGEGVQIGTPMTFVRLAGCNLRCKWCDTDYAFGVGNLWNEEDIVKKADQSWVCLTGGEPMLQDLDVLIEQLNSVGKYIAIETNGTVPIIESKMEGKFERVLKDRRWPIDFWTISPKLSNSGMEKNINYEILADLYDHANLYDCQLKFVIEQTPQDVLEVKEFLETLEMWLGHGIAEPVVLQPQCEKRIVEDKDKYFRQLKQINEEAQKYLGSWDIRVLPQLQKLLEVK